jgi:hypothetical protein
MRGNARSLVTSVSPSARACAAIIISKLPISRPLLEKLVPGTGALGKDHLAAFFVLANEHFLTLEADDVGGSVSGLANFERADCRR